MSTSPPTARIEARGATTLLAGGLVPVLPGRLARAHLARPLVPLLLLAASVVACAGQPAESQEPVATAAVNLPRSYRFEPEAITVPAGTTVTWTNGDNFTHTVRLDSTGEVIGQMAPGQAVTYAFETSGLVAYDCWLHPNDMMGTVLVTP